MPKYRHCHILKKYFFAWNLILAYTFLSVLGTLTVYAEEADNLSIDDAMAGEPQKIQPYIKETIKDWNLKCIAPQNSIERCEANQIIFNDKKQNIGEIRSIAFSPKFKKIVGIAMINIEFCKNNKKFNMKVNDKFLNTEICDLPIT